MSNSPRSSAKDVSLTVESDCVVEMVNAASAAAIVGVSRRSWWRFVSDGKAPKPIRLGRCVRWRVAEIRKWIAGGCSA